jgi:DNA-binding MarR family transcriptional regulator
MKKRGDDSSTVKKAVKPQRRETGPTLTYLIKWMERRVRSELEAALAPFSISVSEYTALSVLNKGKELSSAQLARRTFVSAQAMHPIVVELERKQRVSRRVDPGHSRIYLVRLTESGQKLLGECNVACARAEARAFSKLSQAEMKGLREALQRCVRSIEEN